MPTINKTVPEMDLACPKHLENHMSHRKFKETVEKLYVRDIYGGHFGFYVENICSTYNILVYFLNITPGRLRNQIKKVS